MITVTPMDSLDAAYQEAAPGDTIVMEGGNYTTQFLYAKPNARAPYIVIESAPGAKVTGSIGCKGCSWVDLKGPIANMPDGTVVQAWDGAIAHDVIWENITIDWKMRDMNREQGAYVADVRNVTWRNVEIKNAVDFNSLLFTDGAVRNFVIENSRFHGIYNDPKEPEDIHSQCIYLSGAQNVTIRDSRFWACNTADLFVTGGSRHVTLANNVFEASLLDGLPPGPIDLHPQPAVVFRDGDPLVDMRMINNSIESTVRLPVDGGSATLIGNVWRDAPLWHGDVVHEFNVQATARTWVDPRRGFSTRPGDFRLQAGSNAIGAGDPARHPSMDINGRARKAGRPDAGAYEFGARRATSSADSSVGASTAPLPAALIPGLSQYLRLAFPAH